MHDEPILAIQDWGTNARLIADVARLGYLWSEALTLDCTYGYGSFWSEWRPTRLVGHDLDPNKSVNGVAMDFTNMPYPDRHFDCVVMDPPYMLNGTSTGIAGNSERYGVQEKTGWRERMDLIHRGIRECARVLGGGYFLLKCQDQVCSGKVRWQTDEFTQTAWECGLGKVDRFDFLSYRKQPEGRKQVHARHNASTLLVFKRGWETR